MLAGIAFVASALPVSEATATTTRTAPRTTAIAWAQCNYGLEVFPAPPLIAFAMSSDGIAVRTRSASVLFDDVHDESAVIGRKRFRAVADGLDRSTLFDPPPTPSPGSAGRFVAGQTDPTDIRRTQFAVRRDGAWTDWSIYREYTSAEKTAVWAAYAVASDPKLVWHTATPRANAFAVCNWGAPRDLMTKPRSAVTSLWGVSEIVVADCRHGTEGPDASPVHAYRFMRTGNVARTTADGDSRTTRRTENAGIGFATFAEFGARLEKAGFFQAQDTRASVVATDTPGERISALRDDRLTTWSSGTSSRGNYSGIMSALLAKVSDPGLTWSPGPLDTNAFSICTQ